MNRTNTEVFKLILSAAESFRYGMNETFASYRTDMSEARREASLYKDEEARLNARRSLLIATALERIQKLQRIFGEKMERYEETLREALENHVGEPLNASFRDQLSIIKQFGLKPSRTQLEALLRQNDGNAIGLEALRKVLTDVSSEFAINARTIGDYENDLALIRRMETDPIAYDLDFHAEAVEILQNAERKFIRPDGTTYSTGKWDSTALLIASQKFDSNIAQIDGMQQSWIADVSCSSAEEVDRVEALRDELLASVGAESDKGKVQSSTTIERSEASGVERAKMLGRQQASAEVPLTARALDYVK